MLLSHHSFSLLNSKSLIPVRSTKFSMTSYGCALFIVFPKNNKSNEPAIATKNADPLNPVTETPKIRFARKPPTSAPTIPKSTDPVKLPFGVESTAFATIPTIKPNRIHDKIFICSPPIMVHDVSHF